MILAIIIGCEITEKTTHFTVDYVPGIIRQTPMFLAWWWEEKQKLDLSYHCHIFLP